jgi:hypothetical protein
MQNSDKGKKRLTWPKEDCIRWVEWRLNEWNSVESERRPREFTRTLPAKLDLYVYLAKERDQLSWQQVAIKYFPELLKRSKAAAISAARRAHERIEQAIAPSEKEFLTQWLDSRIKDLFQCTPEDFKKYIRRK